MNALTQAAKYLSFSGPGYQVFAGSEYLSAAGVVDAGTACELSGIAPCSWAIYSLAGFADDMRPTSIRLSGEDYTAEYWLAYADYRSGVWRFGGPYSADHELELPSSATPSGLADFVSPSGTCSIAVLTEEGQSITVNQIELGVDGGAIPPTAPLYIDASGGLEGVLISWFELRKREADFAGFRVERAPLLVDDYVALNSTLLDGPPFLDSTALDGEVYHYRVAAVDTSGNTAYSNVTSGTRGTDSLGPIPVLSMDPGPFKAPATVHFDLSGSYVIGPGVIDTYTVQVLMGPGMSGASPQIDLILQPGCYLAVAQVSMGLESRAVYTWFKVYPQWQNTDRTVIPAELGGVPRLSLVQAARLPQNDDLCVFGYDFMLDSVAVYREEAGEFSFSFQNSLGPVLGINEAVPFGDELALPVAHSEALLPFFFDGERLRILQTFENFGINNLFSMASDGDSLYGVFPVSDGVQQDLVIADVLRPGAPIPLLSNTGVLLDLDCVWNPAVNALDIVYADLDSIEWLRWDPQASVILENAPLDAFVAPARLDLEYEPATGNLGLVYCFGGVWYYRYCDLATWTLPADVDPGVTATMVFDFACTATDRFLYGTHDAGVADLYRYDIGSDSWLPETTPPVPAGASTLSICPSTTAGAVSAGTYVAPRALVHELGPGNTAALLLEVAPVTGLGRSLKAAGGSDGLFVGGTDASGKVYLRRSWDDGLTWDSYPGVPAFATAIDLGTQNDGEIYVSYDNPDFSGDYQIFMWDDPTDTLLDLTTPQAGLPQHRPFLSNSPTEDSITWVSYDDSIEQLNILYGSGGVLLPNFIQPVGTPFWLGTVPGSENRAAFALQSGANIWEGVFSNVHLERNAISGIVDPFMLTGPPLGLGTHPLVISHLMDSTKYLIWQDWNPLMVFGEQYACFTAFGSFVDALRYECDPDGMAGHSTDLPLPGGEADFFSSEMRRTVSAAEAAGLTGVSYICSLDGQQARLQWSNFGDWEDLPLPPGHEQMSGVELLIGQDGRWYLIWHDLRTDTIYSRATL